MFWLLDFLASNYWQKMRAQNVDDIDTTTVKKHYFY